MKKRIVSMVLVFAMVVLMLVGCGAPSIVSRDLTECATFDFEAFKADLGKIEITDGEYTNNPAWREGLVTESVFSGITSGVITADNKLESGTIGANDVVYYVYFTSYTDDEGNVHFFNFDQMHVDTVTASATKTNHVIQMSQVTPDDDDYDFKSKLYEALKQVNLESVYEMDAKADKEIKIEGDESVVAVISYTRSYKNSEDKTVTETALYEGIVLSEANKASDPLVSVLLSEGSVLKINNKVTVKDGTTGEDTSIFKVTDNDEEYTYENVQIKWVVDSMGNEEEVNFKYTPYTAETKVEPSSLHVADTKIDLKDKELTYHIYPIYYYSVPEISAESIIKYILGSKVALTDFDVFSDEAYKSGDKTAKALVEELAELYTLKSSTTKKFTDASDALKAYPYVTVLGKIQTEDFATAAALDDYKDVLIALDHYSQLKSVEKDSLTDAEKAAFDAAIIYIEGIVGDDDAKEFMDLKAAYEAKKAEVDAAGEGATSDQKAALTLAHTEYKTKALELYKNKKDEAFADVFDIALDKKIAEITAATNSAAEEGKKTVGEVVKADKIESTEHSLDSGYRTHVADEVAAAVWALIEKYVKVDESKLPADILEEFTKHLYESYEYEFYKGDKDSKTTNYKYYKGDLNAYLKDTLTTKKFLTEADGDDYMKAIEAEAKTYLVPMIRVFVVAKAFDAAGAQAEYAGFVNKDILAGVYDAHYKNDDSLSEAENAEKKAEAEKSAEKNKESVTEDAKYFLITDEAFDVFKKEQGSSYKTLEETYGERNLRTALQFNKLFDYLVGTEMLVEEHDGSWHSEPKTNLDADETVTEIKVLFHNPLIQYTVK